MKKLASAAVLLLFVSASALAQPPSETPQPPPSAPEAAKPEAAPPSPPEAIPPGQPSPEAAQPTPSTPEAVPGESVSVTEYYKQNVYDASDNAIGEVSDVLLDKDGHVTATILSVGGFLGLGAKSTFGQRGSISGYSPFSDVDPESN
jgi:sporulation protein YlmC with PRC-barrel domain